MCSHRPVSRGPGSPKVETEIPEVVTAGFVLIVGSPCLQHMTLRFIRYACNVSAAGLELYPLP